MDKAIFLDKDGTIVENSNFTYSNLPTDKILKDNIIEGLLHAQEKGYKLFILSNQPWISKGLKTKDEIDNIFQSVLSQLKSHGIKIQEYFYCPHQSSDNCYCKKPSAKLLIEAAKKHNLSLRESFMIGDTNQDIFAGKNADMKTALVLTGDGNKFKDKVNPDHILNDLNDLKKIL